MSMRIIGLTAENVKRLKTIEITPDPHMQVIGGRNAQGKSSVLDAIWLALTGAKAAKATPRPVRDGTDHAEIVLDLGDLTVTRRWNAAGKSALTVTSADGAKYPSPQAMLDKLVGSISFDPLAFTRLSAREQRESLLALVDLSEDLDALDRERADLYAQRTDIGRQGKALGDPTVDESLPAEETLASEVLAELREAQEHNDAIKAARRALTIAEASYMQAEAERIAAEQDASAALVAMEAARTSLNAAGVLVDTAPIEARLADVEQNNARIRENNTARATLERKRALRDEYTDLTEQINALDQRKTDALASATFPVDGLGFDADGVTYQGVPLAQASSAEQIRVAVAMAMAMNPELRVLRVMDGSLLDDEAMAALREQVTAGDYQLWIERVGDSDEGAIIIEDGEVVQ